MLYDNNEIKKGDLMQVIGIDEEEHCAEGRKYLNKIGIVVDIDEDWEYPYTLLFIDKDIENLSGSSFLWKREHLDFQ